MKIIDLTHTFTSSMPVFPGDEPATLRRIPHSEKDVIQFHLQSGLHVGTHMDAPFHLIPHGKRLSDISPEKCIANGHIIDARGMKEIGQEVLRNLSIAPNDCVLLYTGYDTHFREPSFYRGYPVLTEALAHELVKRAVAFVGMDTPSPDRAPYNVHRILLKADVLIIEALANLDKLLDLKRFEIIALPAKFEAEAAPVRVIARVS